VETSVRIQLIGPVSVKVEMRQRVIAVSALLAGPWGQYHSSRHGRCWPGVAPLDAGKYGRWDAGSHKGRV